MAAVVAVEDQCVEGNDNVKGLELIDVILVASYGVVINPH